jgi:hypothetical protein
MGGTWAVDAAFAGALVPAEHAGSKARAVFLVAFGLFAGTEEGGGQVDLQLCGFVFDAACAAVAFEAKLLTVGAGAGLPFAVGVAFAGVVEGGIVLV